MRSIPARLAGLFGALLVPGVAHAHGGEIFVLSAGLQAISAVIFFTVLIPLGIAKRRKLLVAAAYGVCLLIAWMVYFLTDPSVTSVLTLPVCLPVVGALVALVMSRPVLKVENDA